MYRRHFKIIILALSVVGLTSCDHTTYVSIRNYKQPCRVDVTYKKAGNTFFDNDTLLVKPIDSSNFDSLLLRVNSSTDSYYFVAPREKEIALKPTSLGQPIKQVKIINPSHKAWTINLWDRKELKKLKKSGQIKITGFIFRTSIIIENK